MAETTTNHDTIRQWAEKKGGKPAAVDRTHKDGDVGIIRIMFPDAPNSEHSALVEISWDEFFEEFEARQLALLYDEGSLFSKIVGRDTAEKRAEGDNSASRHRGRDDGAKGGGAKGGAGKTAAAKGGGHFGSGKDNRASSTSEGARSGEAARGGRGSGGDEEASLRQREYRDADGTVHHHTRTYMKDHSGKGK
jgi:hypothetical protein